LDLVRSFGGGKKKKKKNKYVGGHDELGGEEFRVTREQEQGKRARCFPPANL